MNNKLGTNRHRTQIKTSLAHRVRKNTYWGPGVLYSYPFFHLEQTCKPRIGTPLHHTCFSASHQKLQYLHPEYAHGKVNSRPSLTLSLLLQTVFLLLNFVNALWWQLSYCLDLLPSTFLLGHRGKKYEFFLKSQWLRAGFRDCSGALGSPFKTFMRSSSEFRPGYINMQNYCEETPLDFSGIATASPVESILQTNGVC